jgi:hypothetical protein
MSGVQNDDTEFDELEQSLKRSHERRKVIGAWIGGIGAVVFFFLVMYVQLEVSTAWTKWMVSR